MWFLAYWVSGRRDQSALATLREHSTSTIRAFPVLLIESWTRKYKALGVCHGTLRTSFGFRDLPERDKEDRLVDMTGTF